jgi:hypothetical protein
MASLGGRLLKAVPIPETSKKTPHTISRMLNAISRVYALIIPTIHKLKKMITAVPQKMAGLDLSLRASPVRP